MPRGALGILGGSFNPIHNGHLYLAEQALRAGDVGEVLFVPTGTPPHKPEGLADGVARLQMVWLAIRGNPLFSATDMEIQRQGNSYTVDTLRALRTEMPERALWLLIGADTLLDLPNWRSPAQVFQLAGFIVCARPGVVTEDVRACQRMLISRGAVFREMEVTGPDISATEIRRRLGAGEPISGMAPPRVEEYLRQTRLYRQDVPCAGENT